MLKMTVYQKTFANSNFAKVYTAYSAATSQKEIIEELAGASLPTTHQGTALKTGDIIVVEKVINGNLSEGTYVYTGEELIKQLTPIDLSNAEKMKGALCLMMQPGFPAVITRIQSNLKALQRAVSDHGEPSLIEYCFPYPDDCMVLKNEEAELINMPLNRSMSGEIFRGPIYIVKDNNYGELKDLSPGDIEWYLEQDESRRIKDEVNANPYLKAYYEN